MRMTFRSPPGSHPGRACSFRVPKDPHNFSVKSLAFLTPHTKSISIGTVPEPSKGNHISNRQSTSWVSPRETSSSTGFDSLVSGYLAWDTPFQVTGSPSHPVGLWTHKTIEPHKHIISRVSSTQELHTNTVMESISSVDISTTFFSEEGTKCREEEEWGFLLRPCSFLKAHHRYSLLGIFLRSPCSPNLPIF